MTAPPSCPGDVPLRAEAFAGAPKLGAPQTAAAAAPAITDREPPSTRTLWVRLPGHAPRLGRAAVSVRSAKQRFLRTLLLGLLWPPACLVGFLIPPHGEPLALAFFGGLYLIRRAWITVYVVHFLEADCPRCAQPLTLKRNARMNRTLELPCYSCHFHPALDLWAVTPEGSGRGWPVP